HTSPLPPTSPPFPYTTLFRSRYRRLLALPGTLTIAISQSGETADTLEAMRAARAAGSRVVGIVNVVGSTIAREADGGIYLHAGPDRKSTRLNSSHGSTSYAVF